MGVEIAMQISKNIAFPLLPGLIGVLFLITTAVEGKSGEYLYGEYGSDSSDTYDSEDIIYEGEEDIYYGDTLDETTLPGLAEETDQAGIIDDTTLPSLAEETDQAGPLDDTTLPGLAEETDQAGPLDDTTLPGLPEETDQAGIMDDTTLPRLAEKTDLKTKFKDNMRAVNEHLEQTLKSTKLANGN